MNKNILFFSIFIMTSSVLMAQKEYNKWSFGISAGVDKATENFTDGYVNERVLDLESLVFELNVRYMFNDKFGLMLDAGYSDLPINIPRSFEEETVTSTFYRVGLSGVANLGSIMNFREWTNRINLLANAGVHIGALETEFTSSADYQRGVSIGLSPQFRLADWVSLNVNVTAYRFEGARTTWDGATGYMASTPVSNSFRDWDAKYYTATVGLDFYLGSHDKHADWVDASDKKELQEEIDDLENRLTTLEEDLEDDDKDGIPNYLDTEPNTPSGVMVDAKGRSIDENNNGIPDEMEQTMDNSFVKVDGSNNQEFQNSIGGSEDMIIRLINDGFVNVYFDFNKDEITDYSYDSINFIRSFMMQHPDVNAELVGFADLYGTESYNNDLSERRAKKVFDILVSTGIDADRLTRKGGGVDNSVGKDTSNDERKVVRKVTFYLK